MKKFKLNLEYFKYPSSKLLNSLVLSKYDFSSIELNSKNPCIYISPRTSRIDNNLIRKCIKDKYVILKEDIISKISYGEMSEEEQNKLLNEISFLTNEGFSVSMLYGSMPTIFGENEPLSEHLIVFLKNTNLDIKFLTFPGEFYSYPIWSDKPRKSKIYTSQQIVIKQRFLKGLNKKEIIKYFNNALPSSATTYLSKYPININSNTLAQGIERAMYCCPNCKKLFTIYSEYSCVKCRDCGMAIEFSPNGKILFSKTIDSFDDIDNFQYKCLSKKDLTINHLIQYNKITQIFNKTCKKTTKIIVILQIYAEKLITINSLTQKKISIYYEDIDKINYLENNTIVIKTKNAKEFCFCGKSNENLLIVKDLVKLNKN